MNKWFESIGKLILSFKKMFKFRNENSKNKISQNSGSVSIGNTINNHFSKEENDGFEFSIKIYEDNKEVTDFPCEITFFEDGDLQIIRNSKTQRIESFLGKKITIEIFKKGVLFKKIESPRIDYGTGTNKFFISSK